MIFQHLDLVPRLFCNVIIVLSRNILKFSLHLNMSLRNVSGKSEKNANTHTSELLNYSLTISTFHLLDLLKIVSTEVIVQQFLPCVFSLIKGLLY